MLTCVYHPINSMMVVEDDEADRLRASGVWFDSPAKAQQYREKVADEIKQEQKVGVEKSSPTKAKQKGN